MTAKKADAPGSVQSAAARKAAEAELSLLVDTYAPAQLKLFGAVRKWLQKRLPTAQELVYEYRDCFVISYSPNEHGYEGVLALRVNAKGVVLYFNFGKDLPDPAKLLQGSGKQTRSIDLEDAAALARPEVTQLIDQAIARTPVPYATTGRGPVLIRPTSASKRRSAT